MSKREIYSCDLCENDIDGGYNQYPCDTEDCSVIIRSMIKLELKNHAWPQGNNIKKIDVCLDCLAKMIKDDVLGEELEVPND